nr:hypothetical protein [uncultured Pseudomonas sp.]
MIHILIAAFDRYIDADEVKQQLITEGIPGDDIQLSASSNPDTIDTPLMDIAEHSYRRDEPLSEKISDFFRSLFGDDADSQAAKYPEAVRRGSTVVTVTLHTDAPIARVQTLMQQYGAIDINERSTAWYEDDARPATASTQTLTSGYPDATSFSIGVTDAAKTTAEELAAGENAVPGRWRNAHSPARDNTAGRIYIVTR